jgi:DNA-binding PadR family transcriptional regulator/polyisoprenoid-binding protein YceI
MDESPVTGQSRFELAPPRRFLLPAILLLLSEEPRHGYMVMKELQTFRFGNVDRPSVYRALAQLEADGYLDSWPETPELGRPRHVYGLTAAGEQVLRSWMGVIKDDRDCLDRVLRRYQATGTADSVLAAVDGNWATVSGGEWSPVPSVAAPRRSGFAVVRKDSRADASRSARASHAAPGRFSVDSERSVILIEVRSSVGPISFGAVGITGSIEATVCNGAVLAEREPRAHLDIPVDELRSGNSLYDAELLRRIDARRFPSAAIDLRESDAGGASNAFRLVGELTFHGVSRPVEGTVSATAPTDDRIVVTGAQVFDIRDFNIASPTVLMLRIYPDVRVRLHVEAIREKDT